MNGVQGIGANYCYGNLNDYKSTYKRTVDREVPTYTVPTYVPPQQDTIDTTVEKPGFGKNVGSGIWNSIKLCVPFVSSYTVGKEYLEQKNAIADLQAMKEGKEPTSKKPGKIKSFFTGVGLKLAQAVPFLGSYLIGHQKIEQDNAIRELNGEEPKKAGFFKSVLTGAATKLGYCIPFVGTYLFGQEFAEQDKLVDKVNELKGEVA